MDDSCPVLLKWAQSFWGRSRKCDKKITQGQTDARKNINRKARSLVLWLRWIEWKNRRGTKFEVKGYVATLIVHRRQQYGNALWKKKSSNFSKCIKFKTNSDHFEKNIFFIRTHKRNFKKIFTCVWITNFGVRFLIGW